MKIGCKRFHYSVIFFFFVQIRINKLQIMHKLAHLVLANFICIVLLIIPLEIFSAGSQKVLITEILAVNNSVLQDEDGDFSDWIEIYNPGTQSINLSGWSLTDNPEKPGKWKFPARSLAPGQYLVIFASEKDRASASGNLHTDFKLSGSGEYLALMEPDLKTISFSYDDAFPVQQKDISFGLYNGQLVYFDKPTPGAENQAGSQVLEPLFSVERGFYNAPFEVSLSAPQALGKIYYSTNGNRPDQSTGTLYTQPITISTTTPLSAVVVSQEGKTSRVVSHTYFFIESIKQQANNPSGYPDEWSPISATANLPADYEMDPEIVNHPDYKDQIDEALLSVPTLSIVTNIDYLFSHNTDPNSGGIYIYTGDCGNCPKNLGIDWERPASVEFIDVQTKQNFQVNCALQLHGGNSRKPGNSQKHSFRITFKKDYGPTKLNFRLFEDKDAANSFNTLVLRAGYNYSWMKNDVTQGVRADYIRDPFTKNTQLAMGQPSAHNRFVHLYLNGLYWGLFNISEKLADDFMEEYMGGKEEDWDVIEDQNSLIDGNKDAWNKFATAIKADLSANSAYQKLQGNNENGTRNLLYDNLLDVDNFIDYMIFNFYIGNKDWDKNNWIAARNRVEQIYGFRFFAWDAETSMLDVKENLLSMNNGGNPTGFFTNLKKSSEFKMKLADRLQKHFFNGGALTPEATLERYNKLAAEINLAIIGESARWGDYRRDVHTNPSTAKFSLLTRNDHWLPEVSNQINKYLPQRSNIVLEQFKNAGLFPSLEAPVFSHYGGKIESITDLGMTAKSGDIYFTTNGSDPRNVGGSINLASAVQYQKVLRVNGSGTIKARAKQGNNWSPLTEATFKSSLSGGFILSKQEPINEVAVQAYPNPFNAFTTIEYRIIQPGKVKVEILSSEGRLVAVLADEEQQAGNRKLIWAPGAINHGMYLYRVTTQHHTQMGKLIYRK